MKYFLVIVLCLFSLLHSEPLEHEIASPKMEQTQTTSTFFYYFISDTVIIPGGGFGIRHKKKHFGADLSLTVPLAITMLPEVKALGLYYPNKKGFYLGAGIGTPQSIFMFDSSDIGAKALTIYGRVAIGYQWEKKDKPYFLQLTGFFPVLSFGRSF